MKSKSVDLLNGSIVKGMVQFCIPLFIGQLLQQLYNIADAWVVGNFAESNAFAAISSGGALSFFIVGFFGGMGTGGGIIISRYYGAGDEENVVNSIHANVLFALICSVIATAMGLIFVPQMLRIIDTPAEVLPYSLQYFQIFFGGICTLIFYNTFMNIMRSVGDSFHPLIYLLISSVINVVLDVFFVAVLNTGVIGAAVATVIAQGISALLCFIRLLKITDYTGIKFSEIFKWHPKIMHQILVQGLPMGLQNSVISIGNIVVQKNINAFGPHAMNGMGAYSKIEGFVFLPINSISMAIPTFISQNLGARKYDRARIGARYSIIVGVVLAEVVGCLFYLFADPLLGLFIQDSKDIAFGHMQVATVAFFYFLLAYSHCAAGVMRGAGKSIIPMVTMLTFWCGIRIVYVTIAVHFIPVFTTISWCYPITWACSSIVFAIWLMANDWTTAYDTQHVFR